MKVAFGVFDWGIGHATRDIPLITELLRTSEVHIISTGEALTLLKNHFGDRCIYYDVPSVYPPYTKTPFFKVKFVFSSGKMIRSLQYARDKSRRIIGTTFDRVISDCRYDVYDKPDNSFLINHQLKFKTPLGAERILEKWLASRMKRYKCVIVPDFEEQNLTGKLSHNLRYISKEKIKYIGILSHVKKMDVPEDVEYFISLSGPEPQRTILQKKITSQSKELEGRIVIAGGNPDSTATSSSDNVAFYGFLGAEQQENIMNRARFIIARPGYTTVMELAELNKNRVLFLPTPGQSEQEYLADYYERQKYFHHVSQYRLKLKRAIEEAKEFTGFSPPWKTEQSVREFVKVVAS
jgi:UDP-N-acetylglucosamine transferase subunit ALG13